MSGGPSAVILNDTRADAHHGCALVMQNLVAGLEDAGLRVEATSPVRHAWDRDRQLLGNMERADVIVVNGEGTLHHGAPAGAALLRIASHPRLAGRKLALINAMYQDNPEVWSTYLRRFDLIFARDRRSAEALGAATGRPVPWVADLTLAKNRAQTAARRGGIVFGDSVRRPVAEHLRRLSSGHTLLPILSHLKRPKPGLRGLPPFHAAWNALHEVRFRWRHPNATIFRTEGAYAEALSNAALHVTGRFHGVCFSLLTRTPFLALRSNSWKVETLVEEAGLSAERVVEVEQLTERCADPCSWAFSASEAWALEEFLRLARDRAEAAFADIAALARRSDLRPASSNRSASTFPS